MYHKDNLRCGSFYDPQDETPVRYCTRCFGEMYFGDVCYPLGWGQTICQACYDETNETSDEFMYVGGHEGEVYIKYKKENLVDKD